MSRPALRERGRVGLWRWWPVLLLPLAGGALLWARGNPWAVERLYCEPVYPLLAGTIGGLTSKLPFSLFEALTVLFLLGAAALIAYLCVRMWRARFRGAPELVVDWWVWGRRAAGLISLAAFVFVFFCGLNYYRPEFASFCGLTVRDSSSAELAALYEELMGEANALRARVPEGADGVMRLSGDFGENARLAREAVAKLADRYPVLPELPISPKPVANSWLMSRAQITGLFTNLTFEANINTLAPDYTVPATMCHELAHSRGFMREDEANFIGYLACLESDSDEVRYSGVMLALVHVNNRLYETDYDAYARIDAMMSDGVRRDFAQNSAYWAQFEDKVVAKVSEAVNDTYLKVNNQKDGTKSYGRMVDLLLADYRARHGLA